MEEVKRKRVAVIGAGVSGLASIKHCLDEGLEPVCFELRSDLGGLWNYVDKVIKGRSSVMKMTLSNTCKETYCYSDFPVPDDFPMFLDQKRMIQYIRLYAAKFDLEPHIRYNTEVIEVKQDESFKSTGRWKVTTRKKKVTFENETDGQTSTEIFDGVMVCNGHHSMPFIPKYKGQDLFRGVQIHSNEYRDFKQFEGKTVVMVGFGNSAAEIACELSRHCEKVYISTHRGAWLLGRLAGNGKPYDLQYNRLFLNKLMSKIPSFLMDYIWAKLMNARFNHKRFGMEPKHGFGVQNPLICDELPLALTGGKLILKDDVKTVTETSVIFQDGFEAKNADVIIYGTGYDFDFPFVNHESFKVRNYKNDFYQFVFPPDIEPPTIAVIGCVQTYGSILAAAEIESRWAAKVLSGSLKLPSKEKMIENIQLKHEIIKNSYLDSMRHKIHYDWVTHMNEIATEIGCKPDIKSIFTKDLRLAMALLFGPMVPSHFRLEGPGTWPKARETILGVWERIERPYQTRKMITGNWRITGTALKLLIILFIFVWLFVL